jgi:hypothetical protein
MYCDCKYLVYVCLEATKHLKAEEKQHKCLPPFFLGLIKSESRVIMVKVKVSSALCGTIKKTPF